MSKIRAVLGLALLAILILFVFLNLEQANVHFIIGRAQMPVAFVILVSAALGAGAVLALRFIKSVKRASKD